MKYFASVRTAGAAFAILTSGAFSTTALGWGGEGHYAVTLLALDAVEHKLGENGPAFLYSDWFRWQSAYQSREPDRLRSTNESLLKHENVPEHFFDVEMLDGFGMSLRTIPRLRYEYIGKVLAAREASGDVWDPEKDSSMTYVWGGTAPYAAMEAYWKLRNDFQVVRLLARQPTTDRTSHALLAQARANAVHHIGDLSHWIGDLSQPHHTTIHHHGWVGDNPNDYTTEYGFHSFIDSGVLAKHGLVYRTIQPIANVTCADIDASDPWDDLLTHIETSFAQVEPMYEIEHDDKFESAASKQFIVDRLSHGSETLAGLIAAAWRHSEPTDDDIEAWARFEPSIETLK